MTEQRKNTPGGLSVPALGKKGLGRALREYADAFQAETGLTTVVRVRSERTIPPDVEQAAFQIVQEALANIVDHAHAARVAIAVHYAEDGLSVRVVDDGQGFTMSQTLDPAWTGLARMTGWAEALGGDLIIQSAPNEGTTVHAILPFREAHSYR